MKNTKNRTRILSILAIVFCLVMALGITAFAAENDVEPAANTNVAKIGNTEYATIDEAIANWTNGTTLTLLADVTLSDVIKLSSTEYHILDLSTYTMTAAKNKDAIQYVVNGRSSAGYALDIKADATNPGGITATGKTIVSHIKPSSNAPSKDRPITRFYGGIFNASYVVKQGGSGLFSPGAGYTGASAPYFQFYGGEYNGTIYTNRSQNQFYGGTFNGSMQMSVDSSAYTQIAGGTFKNLSNSMGSTLNSDKFVIGTSKGSNNGSVCIDENGYYVISTATPAEAEASVASNYNSNNYFYYSTVNTNGMYYEDVYDALEANKTGIVTVFTEELDLSNTTFAGTIVVPEGEKITIVVAEDVTPAWTVKSTVENVEPNVTYEDTNGNELVKGDDGNFESPDPALGKVAQISDQYYETLSAAITAANEGETITLLAPIVVAKGETLTLDKNVTITYTSSVVGEDMFTVRGTLNISAGTITYVNTDTTGNNVTVSTISAEPGSVVNVTGGTVENKTVYSTGSYAYAIDLLTNGNLGDVTVTISGGKVYSDYMAIRQFNNGTACKNTLTVTGGEIYGAKRAIQIHINNDAAYLEISGGKIEAGEGGYALCLFPENATNVAVTGGNFVGEIYSGTNAFVSGGTFTKMYAAYVAEGYVLNENKDGFYGVVKTTVTIGSVEDLLVFAAAVTGNKEYQGVKVAANAKAVVLLNADLDLTNSGFAPIGNGGANAFSGTFDGQDHTISNMTLSCDYYRGVGFFRSLGNGAVVKNVTFVNANVNNGAGTGSNHFYGVVAGFSANLTLDNVNVENSTVTCKYSGAAMVGCLEGATLIKNSTVENVTLTTNNIRAAVYGIIGNSATGHTITVENNTVNNTKLNIKGEIKALPETVGYGSWNAGNNYAETTYVAQNGDKKYSTLIDAIKAATAGDTIILIGNVELADSITIDKNLTIDGNGNTITGTMTLNDDLTVTVQNFNFVNGGIAKATKSTKGNYTIKGCTFNGAGKYAYALSFKGANKVTVEDCTVENYMYGFLYVSSGTVNVSVKDVTVDKCSNYAVYFGSGVNTATFENFTVKNSNNGFILNNTANRYFTIKNCTMENVGTAINYSKGTNTITCTVLGVNDFGTAALSQYANLLAAAKIGNVYYETFAAALAEAKAGDTITLLADLTMSEILVINKAITLDGNGNTLTSTAGRAINVSGADGVTIKNLTINCSGERAINVIQNATNVTIDNVTATADNYTVNVAASAPNAVVTITGSKLTGLNVVNVAAKNADVTVANTTLTCVDNASTEGYSLLCLNKDAVGGSIAATNVTFNITGSYPAGTRKATNQAVGGTVTIDGSTEGVEINVAYIAYGNGTWYGFTSIAAAIEKAVAGDTITLLRDVTLAEIVKIEKAITIDLNGNTVTSTAKKAFEVYANVTIKNGTIVGANRCVDTRTAVELTLTDVILTADKYTAYGNPQPLTIGGSTNGTKVTMNNVTINAGTSGYGIITFVKTELAATNCTINGYSVLYVQAGSEGSEFNFANSNLTATTGNNDVAGNAFAAFAFDASDVTVNVNGGSVTAIGNYSYIFAPKTADKLNVTIDAATVTGNMIVGDAYVVVNNNGVITLAKTVAEVNGTKYATLAEAIAAAQTGDVVKLLSDVTVAATNGGYNKAGVIISGEILDGNGHTLTVTGAGATWDCGIYITAGTVRNITVKGSFRGIFTAGASADIYLDNVNFKNVVYTFNSDAGDTQYGVYISNSTINGWTSFSNAHKEVVFNNCSFGNGSGYAFCRPYNTTVFNGCTFSEDYEIDGSQAQMTFQNMAAKSVYALVDGAAAIVARGNDVVTYTTLVDAFAAAQDGDIIVLVKDITISEGITNTKKITLDLNGYTITGTDTATGSFGLITNKGELTITGNGTMTLVAPNNNRGWNAYSSVISNTVGGKLVVVNGTIEHLGGTDMAYAIDNLTNGKGTYAETVINGGTIKSTYRAIRMFLNGTEAQNILTVNGGVIEGANKSIWMQDPSKNANTGSLTVTKGATLNGDVYLTVTEGSTEWPVEVSIAATAVNGEVLTNGNAPERYVLEKKSGNWVVNEYVAKVSNGKTTYYYADLQTALNKTPKYYTVYLLDNYSGDALVVGTNNKATTDGMGITLNGFTLTADITLASPSNKFTFTLSNGTMNGNIVANDGLTLTDVTVNGNIEVNSACTIKADAAVTGTINVVGNGVLTVKDGAMINGVAFSTEAYLSGKVMGINVAYYVLNYNKNVYSFYANKADADALAAKYRGYKTYAV